QCAAIRCVKSSTGSDRRRLACGLPVSVRQTAQQSREHAGPFGPTRANDTTPPACYLRGRPSGPLLCAADARPPPRLTDRTGRRRLACGSPVSGRQPAQQSREPAGPFGPARANDTPPPACYLRGRPSGPLLCAADARPPPRLTDRTAGRSLRSLFASLARPLV